MTRLRHYWKRFLCRCCWAMLKAADFDNIANELLEAVTTYADPAAQIPKNFAELKKADQELLRMIKASKDEVTRLEAQIHALNRTIDRMGAAAFRVKPGEDHGTFVVTIGE